MNDQITQDQVNQAAWSACDSFRGAVDAGQYKDYILVMLFVKYVSDLWASHMKDYKEQYGDDEARIRRRLERERFVLPEGSSFYDLHENRSADNIGELINVALEAIEDASDAGKKAGEFFTPAPVSQLLAKLAGPKPGHTICDPACGSGSLLIRAAEEVGSDNYALYGQEVNGATWALARMNMFLHAKDAARIEWCDTLNSPTLLQDDHLIKFDTVVANPPFSLKNWGAENAEADTFKRFWRGVPPKSKGDYGFITHMIEIAKRQSGRVALIVPHGVLFRGGAEGKIRRKLIENENLLDAVIGLPANLFTTTGIPVAILIFDRSREPEGPNHARKDVLFIDASKEFTPSKTQNVLERNHIDRIMDAYEARKFEDKFAYVATPEEMAENDYNLNIPRYVDTFEPEEEIDVAKVQEEINQIESELIDVRKRMVAYLKELESDA